MNSKSKKRYTSQKGITLIALVITIIVLLILAGVTISMVLGDEGIIAQAQKTDKMNTEKSEAEIIEMIWTGRYVAEKYGTPPEKTFEEELQESFPEKNATVNENIVTIGENIYETGIYGKVTVLVLLDSKYYTNDAINGFLIKDEYKGDGANANQLPTTIVIPNGVTKIGFKSQQAGGPIGAFTGTKVTKVVIPESVTMIGPNAFGECENLTNINILQGVTDIGTGAFQNCKNLTNVKLGDSITTLGAGAFNGCASLTEIEIPASVTSIGISAFNGCTNATFIVGSEDVKTKLLNSNSGITESRITIDASIN